MPGLLVPGLFPVGGRVGSGSGSLLHKMGGGPPYSPQCRQRARPWKSGGPT